MKKITLVLGFTLLAVFIFASFLITRNSNGLSADQMPVVVPAPDCFFRHDLAAIL